MSGPELASAIWTALDAVKDPCMQAAGLDISLVGLGIVRAVDVTSDAVSVTLGLTEPGCGFTHVLMTHVEDAIQPLVGARTLDIGFDWKEPWTEDKMADDARDVFRRARARSAPMLARLGLEEVRVRT